MAASPSLPLFTPENSGSATRDPGDLTNTAEGTNIPSLIGPEPTGLVAEAQETELSAEELVAEELNTEGLAIGATFPQEIEAIAEVSPQEAELVAEAFLPQETELAAEELAAERLALGATFPQEIESTEEVSPQDTEPAAPQEAELAAEGLAAEELVIEVVFPQEIELPMEGSPQETGLATEAHFSQETELIAEAAFPQETGLVAEVSPQETELAETLFPQETEPAIDALSPQATGYGGHNSAMVAIDKTSSSPHDYHSGVSCFSCVLRVAIGLSVGLAFTSLLLLCFLSRRGQYIWINTINIVGTQNPISQETSQQNRRNDPEPGGLAEEMVSSGQNMDGLGGRSATGSQHGLENLNISSVSGRDLQPPKRSFLPRGWITLGRGTGGVGATGTQDTPKPDRPGFFQRWFGPNSSQTGILKGPGFIQRWFGWRGRKHVNFDDAPFRGLRNGPKIRSVRTRGSPDPSIILTEVAERLVRERMRQLSTILSIGEEEEAIAAIVGSAAELETPSMSSMRAVATGSTMGTQRRDNTIKRSRRGAINDMDGISTPFPVSATDDSAGVRDEIRGEESVVEEEREPNEKSIHPVRAGNNAGSTKGKGRGIFGRSSIKRYLFPTVTDDTSTEEVSAQGGTVVDAQDSVKKEEGTTGSLQGNTFNPTLGDAGNAASAGSTFSGATGVELTRQSDGELEVDSESGSSMGDDSTLIMGSNENIESVLVDGQLSVEEEGKLRVREPVAVSGFGMGSDLVLSRPMRTRSEMRMKEEILSDERGVSAFGLRAKSPRSSNADSEVGECEFSSGYFTESSSHDDVEGEPGSGSFPPPVGPIRDVDVDGEVNMRGVLGGKLRVE